MGIREAGYRHWEGTYTGHAFRWWTIGKQGLRSTIYSKGRLVMLLLFMFLVWAPFIFWSLFWFVLGESEVRAILLRTPDTELRKQLYQLVAYWQTLVIPLYVGTVGAPLVSNDLRTNALYVYLAKPMRRIDYIAGKLTTILLWGLPVTLLPSLVVWASAISSSNEQLQLSHPGEILLELALVQFFILVVLGLVAVALSSLTKRWQVAFMGFLGLNFVLQIVQNVMAQGTRKPEWTYLSLSGNFINFAERVFERPVRPPGWETSLLLLVAVAAVALGVFLWRILKLEVAE